MKLTDIQVIRGLQKKYGFRTKKKFGQNFLLDTGVIEDILEASMITPEDVVVEIGPGIGTLTQALCERGCRVLAVEIDEKLSMLLQESVPYDNLQVLFRDVLKTDLDKEVRLRYQVDRYKVVANLPYYITSPIIMKLLQSHQNIQSITVMTQKEVAERMQASPGGKEYGSLSVAVQYYAHVELVRTVPPESFSPAPQVDSAVIHLEVLEEPFVLVQEEELFFALVKGAFQQRRKTLLNTLSHNITWLSKEQWKKLFLSIDMDGQRRGETLSLQEFATISNALSREKSLR